MMLLLAQTPPAQKSKMENREERGKKRGAQYESISEHDEAKLETGYLPTVRVCCTVHAIAPDGGVGGCGVR